MAATMFATGIRKMHDGGILAEQALIKAVLLNSTGVNAVNQDTHDFLNDLDAAANRILKTTTVVLVPLTIETTGLTYTLDTTNNETQWDSTQQLVWTTVGVTGGAQKAKGILVFKSSGANTTSPLICMLDFSAGALTTNGSDITIDFDAEGLFKATY